MRARGLCLAAIAAALIPASSGCGGVGTSGAAEPGGNELTVYSSLPLQGVEADVSAQIVDGEKLALAQAGGHVGRFTVAYVSLDDANPVTGHVDPGAAASNAETAARDPMTIAYLGDLDSPATAVSLPLINAAGILQVSPASPYIGLTSTLDAGQDEPSRFYPSGHQTFARLQPGDQAQARAQASLMKALGVHRIFLLNDEDPFNQPLARIVAGEAESDGIVVAGRDSVPMSEGELFEGEVRRIVRSGADALFYAGAGGPATVTLWRELHLADPNLKLLGTSALARSSFTEQLGDAAARTYLTTPVLPLDRYPRAAARVLGEFRRRFGGEAGAYALYGYEAMSVVLDSIRRAGRRGNDRRAVIASLYATQRRDSVLGRYSIEPDGETTLSDYAIDRVVAGRPSFMRSIATR